MILVDTSVLIDFFKGIDNEPARKLEIILTQQIPFGINSCIYQEILQGARSEQEFDTLKNYLKTQRFYQPLDPVASFENAARLYFQCRKKGITIRSTIDCLIAQTAIEYNLALLHNDKDFTAMAEVCDLKCY